MPEVIKAGQRLIERPANPPQDAPAQTGSLPKVDLSSSRTDLHAADPSTHTLDSLFGTAPATTVQTKSETQTAKNGPQTATQAAVITVSGGHTSIKNPMFDFVDKIAPDSTRIATGTKSMSEVANLLRTAIDADLAQGKSVLVVGHSLGAVVAFNMIKNEYKGEPVTGIYIESPFNSAYRRLPILRNTETGRAINEAVHAGVANDINAVDWTGGRPFLGLNFLTHDAFDFPKHGNNQEHLARLHDFIRNRLDAIETPATKPELALNSSVKNVVKY